MNIDLTVTLNQELSDAAESLRAKYALGANQENLTLKTYFETVIAGIIEGERRQLFKITADALVAGAEALPYESRLALIAQVEAQLNP